MKPVFQTIFGNKKGNCLQACLASIFELELDQVPNFMELDREVDKDAWWRAYYAWLAERNLGVIAVKAEYEPQGYHLILVWSPRGNWLHTLVGFDSIPIHDPFPGGDCKHEGVHSVQVFYVLDPAKLGPK